VVGCRVGGVPEVVTHEEDGVLVPPGDAPALLAALDRLMGDEALRVRLGVHAARTVETDRSHVALADRMVAQYRLAMASYRAEPGPPHTVGANDSDSVPSVLEAALDTLDKCSSTKGVSLACRASDAFEHGERTRAAELIVQALGIGAHPDFYAMAVELALSDGDAERATEFALRGFEATHDDSDTCVAFAATIQATDAGRRAEPAGWAAWQRTHMKDMPTRCLSAALTAIRTGRDGTAIALLECCRDASGRDRRLLAQVQYHLGSALKRRDRASDARACFEEVLRDGSVILLAAPLQSALHFHLGELDLRDGRVSDAVRHFEACLALNPAHGRARALLDEATESAHAVR
jgi:tetratricopeptide (TPR) repeat protein